MATRIRLRRIGRKKQAAFRIVVAAGRHPRDGRSTETIGRYNPRTQPSFIEVDERRALYWLRQGAQPSDSVKALFRETGILQKLAEGAEGEGLARVGDHGGKTIIGIERKRPSKKAASKAAAAAAAGTAQAETPAAETAQAEAPAVETTEVETPEAETAEAETAEAETAEAEAPAAETTAVEKPAAEAGADGEPTAEAPATEESDSAESAGEDEAKES